MDKIVASLLILALMVGFLMFIVWDILDFNQRLAELNQEIIVRVLVLEKHDLVTNYEKHKTTYTLPDISGTYILNTGEKDNG